MLLTFLEMSRTPLPALWAQRQQSCPKQGAARPALSEHLTSLWICLLIFMHLSSQVCLFRNMWCAPGIGRFLSLPGVWSSRTLAVNPWHRGRFSRRCLDDVQAEPPCCARPPRPGGTSVPVSFEGCLFGLGVFVAVFSVLIERPKQALCFKLCRN